MNKIFVLLIKIYQIITGVFPIKTCRFYPSCSDYMQQSVIKYGFIKGVGRGCYRLLRCHPFHPGGYDPVG